ncbi:Cdk-activating kinase assembly factor MAT1/Tfb3 protein [Dioscorea alata]|uniref:Cdk-activating kinase assembly factor MAT1/Tfb3 protein n=1 Tax=Dioscorea alata TaxID=55571 RepID=A0ACB7WJ45_DIOAL|nr:Cdk-activating kinase assembly factor MAT1/Tfb3 protein [Dioscorea alata]
MGEDNVAPDLQNWLICINTYSQQGKLWRVSVLTMMQEAGYSPNISVDNTLIMGSGKQTNVKAAELVFQRLQTISLEPAETTYRSMIEGFGRADYYREVVQYYVEVNSRDQDLNQTLQIST